jgi:hypothetical protein
MPVHWYVAGCNWISGLTGRNGHNESGNASKVAQEKRKKLGQDCMNYERKHREKEEPKRRNETMT